MLPRDWKERIQDILDAIGEIQAFTFGITFTSFCADAKTVKAVELDLIVIGEAANQIPNFVVDQIADNEPRQMFWLDIRRKCWYIPICVTLSNRNV